MYRFYNLLIGRISKAAEEQLNVKFIVHLAEPRAGMEIHHYARKPRYYGKFQFFFPGQGQREGQRLSEELDPPKCPQIAKYDPKTLHTSLAIRSSQPVKIL